MIHAKEKHSKAWESLALLLAMAQDDWQKIDQDIINLPSMAACPSLRFCPNRTFQRRTAAIRAKDKHNRARESLALLFAMAGDDCQKM